MTNHQHIQNCIHPILGIWWRMSICKMECQAGSWQRLSECCCGSGWDRCGRLSSGIVKKSHGNQMKCLPLIAKLELLG